MTSKNYAVRLIDSFDRDDLLKIRNVFKACYGPIEMKDDGWLPSVRELKWRFADSPYGASVWAAFSGEEIVGLRPAIHKELKYKGETYKAAQFLNAMTHPDFRRQRIYSTLLKKALNYFKDKNINIIYTFPNENSYPVYRKLKQWRTIGELALYTRPILNLSGLTGSKHLKNEEIFYKNGVTIKKSNQFVFPPELLLSDHSIHVVRTEKYSNWRYMKRPDAKYIVFTAERKNELLGYIVLRIKRRRNITWGIVSEFFVNGRNRNVGKYLLDHAIGQFCENKVRFILFAHSPDRTIDKIIKRKWFVNIPQRYLPRGTPVVVHIDKSIKEKAAFKDIKNWTIMFGDNDAA